MDSKEVGKRFLDASIKVMERNRTLLFTINLIAALVLVIIYLERISIDTNQHTGHLIAYSDACKSLKSKSVNLGLSSNEQDIVNKCSDLAQIGGIFASREINQDILKQISKDLYRLNRIQNDMKSIKLDSAVVAPLGFGLPVPRNDLTLICGILMVLFYTWLAFSFKQHARIIKEVTLELQKEDNGVKTNILETFNRVVEVNFMFPTQGKGLTPFFVKLLYFAAPISMTFALINDLLIPTDGNYRNFLNEILIFPRFIEVSIVVILWVIAYNINQSDTESNEVTVVNN